MPASSQEEKPNLDVTHLCLIWALWESRGQGRGTHRELVSRSDPTGQEWGQQNGKGEKASPPSRHIIKLVISVANWGWILLGALWGTRKNMPQNCQLECWREGTYSLALVKGPTGQGSPCGMSTPSRFHVCTHISMAEQLHVGSREMLGQHKISTVQQRPAAVRFYVHTAGCSSNSWSKKKG